MKLLLVLCAAVIALAAAAPETAPDETGFEPATNETATHTPLKKGVSTVCLQSV